MLPVSAYYYQVVHVSLIVSCFLYLFHGMVKMIEQRYSEDLHHLASGLIPDWIGVLPLKPGHCAVDSDAVEMLRKANRCVIVSDMLVISAHVYLKHPSLVAVSIIDVETAQLLIETVHGPCRAFSLLAGHVVENEAPRHGRVYQIVVKAPLYDAVTDMRRGTRANLRVVQGERVRLSRLIRVIGKLFFKLQAFLYDMKDEPRHGRLPHFAELALHSRLEQRFKFCRFFVALNYFWFHEVIADSPARRPHPHSVVFLPVSKGRISAPCILKYFTISLLRVSALRADLLQQERYSPGSPYSRCKRCCC